MVDDHEVNRRLLSQILDAMVRTRTQIHEGKKITLSYRDEHGRPSERTIWPIAVGYHEAVRILAACVPP